jgi:hypothetical protein
MHARALSVSEHKVSVRTSENSVNAKFGTTQDQTAKSVSEGVSPSRGIMCPPQEAGGEGLGSRSGAKPEGPALATPLFPDQYRRRVT